VAVWSALSDLRMVEKSSVSAEGSMQTWGSPLRLIVGHDTKQLASVQESQVQGNDLRGSGSKHVDVLVLPVPFPERALDPYLQCPLSTLPSSAFHLCMASCRRIFRMAADRLGE